MMKKNQLELLAPAGSYDIFKAVLNAGADAVYVGGSQFGARAYANNFSKEELLLAIDEAHIHGKQLYLTVNTLLKEDELETQLYDYLLPYYEQGLDAVIVQDMGAFQFIREHFPKMDIHTSTQMTICNRYGAEMMKELGASRVVTAREMSFAEIKDIADHVDIEIESFVHGALCYCFSGQCLLSSMIGGRSGNRGRCAQPCRLPYEVYDAKRKKIASEPFVLSPKDLCTIDLIPKLAESGIFSFKIEGRMKQAEYAAGVVSVYRKYMDRYLEYGAKDYQVTKEDMQKLYDFGNRSGFTKGYYEKHNGKDMITFQKPNHAKGNETLQEKVREDYCRGEIKEKINGNLILSQDSPAILTVTWGDFSYTANGDLVQPALKQPLSMEKVRENMEKTGNTPFTFENLSVSMQDAVFLPMKSLNQLRRDALEGLEKLCIKAYRRSRADQEDAAQNENDSNEESASSRKQLSVLVERRCQLPPLLESGLVQDIYLDQTCYHKNNLWEQLKEDVTRIHQAGKDVYYVFPTVFRKNASDFYAEHLKELTGCELDGVVVKSLDAVWFVKKHLGEMPVILDQGLYTYNNRALAVFREFQPIRMTAPYELNRSELKRRENIDSEIVLYGYLPLMTSAQCVHANTGKCDKTPVVTYLKDRYGKFFPVKNNCMECYNTIYNTTPLMLFGYGKELRKADFSKFRLNFTVEGEDEVRKILEIYKTVFCEGSKVLADVYQGEYTNGHYKRGVE